MATRTGRRRRRRARGTHASARAHQRARRKEWRQTSRPPAGAAREGGGSTGRRRSATTGRRRSATTRKRSSLQRRAHSKHGMMGTLFTPTTGRLRVEDGVKGPFADGQGQGEKVKVTEAGQRFQISDSTGIGLRVEQQWRRKSAVGPKRSSSQCRAHSKQRAGGRVLNPHCRLVSSGRR